eukprot:358517-Chlamydomonas_euryale.AAC.2
MKSGELCREGGGEGQHASSLRGMEARLPQHVVRTAEDLAARLVLRLRHLSFALNRLALEDEAEELESDKMHPQVVHNKLRVVGRGKAKH